MGSPLPCSLSKPKFLNLMWSPGAWVINFHISFWVEWTLLTNLWSREEFSNCYYFIPSTLFYSLFSFVLTLSTLLALHWLIKLCRFKVYNSVTPHLHIALFAHHAESCPSPSAFTHHLPSLLVLSPISLWYWRYCCHYFILSWYPEYIKLSELSFPNTKLCVLSNICDCLSTIKKITSLKMSTSLYLSSIYLV